MERENRVFFDQDGEILFQTGEMSGDVLPHKDITHMGYIDIPYGSIDYTTHYVAGVDRETGEPIIKEWESRDDESV